MHILFQNFIRRYAMPRSVQLLLVSSCFWAIACTGSKPTSLPPAKYYTLHGTVLSLNAKDHTAHIKGENIPGWMDAMTMDYPVKNENDWKALQPNEVISATLEVRDQDYALTAVKRENSK